VKTYPIPKRGVMQIDSLHHVSATHRAKEERQDALLPGNTADSKTLRMFLGKIDIEIDKERPSFTFALNRKKLRTTRRREGRYLLRTSLTENDPAQLWQYYTQLVAVEEAFRNLKGDLAIRPVFHQDEKRIEAHIFIAFLAYCMQITLTRRLHALAPGLTARSALDKFAAVQMIDVHLPTTDGREILLTRYTHPEPELQLVIDRLKLRLPPQPPPRITTAAVDQARRRSEDLLT
jgi:Transposase DDE domain